MALISEWVEQCGKKVLDNAGIVRDAMFCQLYGPRLPARDCKTTVIDHLGFSWLFSRATSAFVSHPDPFDFR